jgi:uncharacterized protein YabE (DUF348 family)/3D (Asp-Asp-Asp) domain-containing protein
MQKVKNVKDSLRRYFSVRPKSTFIILLLIIALSLTVYNMRKTLIVNIDGNETEIVTYNNDLKGILAQNQIVIESKDKIYPAIDSRVQDGDRIYIKKAVNINVLVDGKKLKIGTTEDCIEKMLAAEGIMLNSQDKITPTLGETIKDGLVVQITRVEHKMITEKKPIGFSTIVKKTENLEKGKSKITQEGVPGERETSTKIIMENGKEIARQVVSDITTKKPVSRVLLQGNMNVIKISRGGKVVSKTPSNSPAKPATSLAYKKVFRMRATAYEPRTSGSKKRPGEEHIERTASGTIARRNPNGYSTIAVDPRVIPLGTKVYVEGYGLAIAEDTGGAIKGNRIDVFFYTYNEMRRWGVKHVNVYILK